MLTLLMENAHATDGKAHATGGKMLMLLMGKLTLLAEKCSHPMMEYEQRAQKVRR